MDPFVAETVYGASVYLRLHGRGTYRYRYSDDELTSLSKRTLDYVQKGCAPVYVLFNNMWMKEDGLRFQSLIGPP